MKNYIYVIIKYFILISILLLVSCDNQAVSYEKVRSKFSKILLVDPMPEHGFHWPYLLFIPKRVKNNADNVSLIIFPNNTGKTSDDFTIHQKSVLKFIKYYFESLSTDEINTIALSPIFPRWKTKMGGWENYTHSLDRDTLIEADGALERIDLQLVAMIEDATEKLTNDLQINVEKKILMFGFSASAHFVDRFSFLHPELVESFAIGGFNGHLMLPLETLDDSNLIYPVGLYDYENITGYEFKETEYRNIDKFYFLGDMDTNDDVPFNDGYDDDERELIYKYFGEVPKGEPVSLRTPFLEIKMEMIENSTLKIYENVDHLVTKEIFADIRRFFEVNVDQ